MKVFKYVTVLLAVAAMSATFFSCNRENDITGDPFGGEHYWIDFTLSNPGSLSQAAQDRFVELRDTIIYGEKGIKIMEHPMTCTEQYAKTNFEAVAAVANAESDIVQKIMIPTFCVDTPAVHNDFVVTMTLSKDSMRTVIATHTWNASSTFDAQEIINKNK